MTHMHYEMALDQQAELRRWAGIRREAGRAATTEAPARRSGARRHLLVRRPALLRQLSHS